MILKFLILLVILNLALSEVFSQNIDIDVLRNVNLNRNRQLDNTFRLFTNSAAPLAFSTPALLYGIGLMRSDTVMQHKAAYIGLTVISSAAVATILKYSVNRPRPFTKYTYLENVTSGGSPSFPSGHTSDAFALATSLSIAYPKWYVIAPSYVWATAVGYSRMDLGVHYPSDVLIGALIGAGSAYLCYKGQRWLNGKKRRHPKYAQKALLTSY